MEFEHKAKIELHTGLTTEEKCETLVKSDKSISDCFDSIGNKTQTFVINTTPLNSSSCSSPKELSENDRFQQRKARIQLQKKQRKTNQRKLLRANLSEEQKKRYAEAHIQLMLHIFANQDEFRNIQDHLQAGKTYVKNVVWPELLIN